MSVNNQRAEFIPRATHQNRRLQKAKKNIRSINSIRSRILREYIPSVANHTEHRHFRPQGGLPMPVLPLLEKNKCSEIFIEDFFYTVLQSETSTVLDSYDAYYRRPLPLGWLKCQLTGPYKLLPAKVNADCRSYSYKRQTRQHQVICCWQVRPPSSTPIHQLEI